MNEVKVSIIIPLFNAINCIAETLDSITNQSQSNIEIIVIDDGSTDGSFEYVSNINSDIITLRKNNKKGACAARNYGFELATGDYIQYLDADDILSPNKIKDQLDLAKLHGENIVYSCKWYHFNTSVNEAKMKTQAIDKDYSEPSNWLNDSWLGKGMGQTSIWLTHRSLIEKAGLWNEKLLINQDGEFFSRVLLHSKGIKFVESAIVYYRTGSDLSISQSNKFSKEKATSLLDSYMLYKTHALQFNVIEEVKEGLANNFLTFIYSYYNLFPNLVNLAEEEFKSTGYDKMWPVGGHNFKKFASVLGFKSVLKLRALLQLLKQK